MNTHFEDLMYWAGLTAQGCWDQMDEYDRKAIEKLAELIVCECAELVDQEWNLSGVELKEHFGIDK
jgi:hypothetical protein